MKLNIKRATILISFILSIIFIVCDFMIIFYGIFTGNSIGWTYWGIICLIIALFVADSSYDYLKTYLDNKKEK